MEMMGGKNLGEMWSSLAGLMFIFATFQQLFPRFLKDLIQRQWNGLMKYFNRTMHIKFQEFSPGLYRRSKAYVAIESYLSTKSAANATFLRAEVGKEFANPLVLALDDHEHIIDEFHGVKVKWYRGKRAPEGKTISWSSSDTEKRHYTLIFNKKYRELIIEKYINFVIEEGEELQARRSKRRLYMNTKSDWEYAVFEHPASFDTFAMDPERREKLVSDLVAFSNGKEYYKKIGKIWKRGYLLYGPPGTGKSTMIAAMSNLLGYDIFDLELTTVKDNAELKTLLINTESKSIIVIEDIDCTVDFTKKRPEKKDEEKKIENTPIPDNNSNNKKEGDKDESKVTLSGLLNIIDGMWSGCAGERIVVFTTNHADQLDPALIRRGRMDMHIELSYCTFGAFKVLAKNYLDIDSHPLFEKVRELLESTNTTPADVAENLTPKELGASATSCLEDLIRALEAVNDAKGMEVKKEEKEEQETKI